MKHARPDYDRIQDPAGLIPEDEPVVLFRAQDQYTPAILEYYADLVEQDHGDPEIVRTARAHVERILDWQVEVKCKAPDMPR